MPVKKIRILHVLFENEIQPWEVPAFRGAVIATAGKQNILFHNHQNETFRYGYPLIQYKEVDRKPMLMSIDQGIEEIHHFFEKMQLGILLGDRPYELKIDNLNMNQFTLQVWDKMWDYSMRNWIALNQNNYPVYIKIEALSDKISFLENLLKANILSFAKGIGWEIENQIEAKIKYLSEPRLISLKGLKVMSFNCDFSTNVFLPNYLGLGKSVALGYGILVQKKYKS